MSLKFEKMWAVNTYGPPLDMVSDGKFIYVLKQGHVNVYSWWGSRTDHEPTWDNYEMLNWAKDTDKLYLEAEIEAIGFSWIFLGDNCIWLVSSTATIKKLIIDPIEFLKVPTGTWATDFTMSPLHGPVSAVVCNPCFADNKFWFLEKYFGGDEQYIFYVDTSKIVTSFPFQERHQEVRADIVNGYNGYIYITSWNKHSVLKYNYVGQLVSNINVNANPYKLRVDETNRRIYVASHAGMISYIDSDTDVVTHAHSTAQEYGEAPYQTITSDGVVTDFALTNDGYLWYITIDEKATNKPSLKGEWTTEGLPITTGKWETYDPESVNNGEQTTNSLGRIQLSTNKHVFTKLFDSTDLNVLSATPEVQAIIDNLLLTEEKTQQDIDDSIKPLKSVKLPDKDYYIASLPDVKPDRVLVTQGFTYSHWNGTSIDTITVSPYLFVLGASKLMAARLVNELCRESSISVKGHTMISQTPYDYTGNKA